MADRKTQRFRDAYKRYRAEVLEPSRVAIKDELRTWKRERRWKKYRGEDETIPSPVQRTRVRIKRLESVEDKIARHPQTFPGGLTVENLKRMKDLLGARLILYFVTDFPLIDRELHAAPEVALSRQRPPKAFIPRDLAEQLGMTNMDRVDKESGYASIHYQCKMRTPDGSKTPQFELQVRTLAEDVWGEIEHILGYKPGKQTALPVRREFQILSKQLGAIDEQFALLYHGQRIHRQEITISPEHPPNPENLPRTLSEMELHVAQGEVDGLLRVMASRGIESIGELQLRGSPHRIHIIRRAWEDHTRRIARTFDVVAVLGTIRADSSDEEVLAKTIEWATVAEEWSKRLGEDAG